MTDRASGACPEARGPLGVSSPLARHFFAALLLTALTLALFDFVTRRLTDGIGPGFGDPMLNLYFLKWGAHCFDQGLRGFWSAPFFFPTPGVMTLSDHLLGPAAFTWLLGTFGIGAVTSYNVLFLLSFIGTGWGTYFVLSRSGLGWSAALFGAVAVTFGHSRLNQMTHLQILLAIWIPLAYWSFDRLLARPSVARAALFFAFYSLQVTAGSYLAYMIHFPLAALAVNRLADAPSRQRLLGWRPLLVLAGTALACLGTGAVVFLPYWRFAEATAFVRPSDEVLTYAGTLGSWLTPTPATRLGSLLRVSNPGENALFPGFLPSALAALGLLALWQRSPRSPRAGRAPTSRLLVAASAALVAAGLGLGDLYTRFRLEVPWRLGPVDLHRFNGPALLLGTGLLLGAFVLRRRRADGSASAEPEASRDARLWRRGLLWTGAVSALLSLPVGIFAFRSWLPGMAGLRVPSRFWACALPAFALLCAIGWDACRSRFRSALWRRLGAALALALLVAELAPQPQWWRPLTPEADLPATLRLIPDDPAVRALLVLPLFGDQREAEYMYLASFHWRPIANGFSGFLPPSYRRLQELFSPFPEPEKLRELRRTGITHLLVHFDLFPPAERPAAYDWLLGCEKAGVLQVVREEEAGLLLYAITAS